MRRQNGGCIYMCIGCELLLVFNIYIYIYIYIYLQEKMTVWHDGRVGRMYGAISPVRHGLFLPLMGRGPIGKSDGLPTTSRSRSAFGRGRGMRWDRAVTPPVGVNTAPSSSSGPPPPHVLTSPATSASLPKQSFSRGRASRFIPLIPSLHSSTVSSTPPPPGAFIGGGGTLKPHPYPPLIPSIDLRFTSTRYCASAALWSRKRVPPLFVPTYTICRMFNIVFPFTCTQFIFPSIIIIII